jgi:hypothetical protein
MPGIEADGSLASALSLASTSLEAWGLLEIFARRAVGHRLFTVTTVEDNASLARRLYSSNVDAYPLTGTKPLPRDAWHEHVLSQMRIFSANTLESMKPLFPDHGLIQALGCGAVINLPIITAGTVVATVNLLDAEGSYPPERVKFAERVLGLPALACWALARSLAKV